MLENSRPILLRNRDPAFPDYPYLFGGTCFMVGVNRARLAVTCAHVAFNGDETSFQRVESITVPLRLHCPEDEPTELANFIKIFHRPALPVTAPELGDITFLELHPDQVDELVPFWPLGMPSVYSDIGPVVFGQRMVAFGYPTEGSVLDFDLSDVDGRVLNTTFRMEPWKVTGFFVRWDNNSRTIGVMQVDGMYDDQDVPREVSLNGFSGAPVYVQHLPNGTSWGGMIITAGNGLVRFIRSSTISTQIQKILFKG